MCCLRGCGTSIGLNLPSHPSVPFFHLRSPLLLRIRSSDRRFREADRALPTTPCGSRSYTYTASYRHRPWAAQGALLSSKPFVETTALDQAGGDTREREAVLEVGHRLPSRHQPRLHAGEAGGGKEQEEVVESGEAVQLWRGTARGRPNRHRQHEERHQKLNQRAYAPASPPAAHKQRYATKLVKFWRQRPQQWGLSTNGGHDGGRCHSGPGPSR